MRGSLVASLPGDEARTLRELPSETLEALRQPGAVIMVGERLAMVPGALSAAATLADETGAALVWVPRMFQYVGVDSKGLPPDPFLITVLVRDAVVVTLCVLVVRSILRRPEGAVPDDPVWPTTGGSPVRRPARRPAEQR